jgi:hypothetical protein
MPKQGENDEFEDYKIVGRQQGKSGVVAGCFRGDKPSAPRIRE